MICFNMQNNFSTSLKWFFINFFNLESARTIRAPFMSRLSTNFGNNFDMVGDDEGRIETNTKLTNNVIFHCLALLLHVLHELFGPALGNCAEVGDEILFWHSHSIVLNCDLVFGWRNFDTHVEILVGLSKKSLLLQSIRGIGKQFS